MARPPAQPKNKSAKAPDASRGTTTASQSTRVNNNNSSTMPKKRGRPRKQRDTETVEGSGQPASSSSQSKPLHTNVATGKQARKRTSVAQEESVEKDQSDAHTKTFSKPSGSKKRKSQQDAPDEPTQRKRHKIGTFARLKPRTRHIPQAIITSKWKMAPVPAQAAIKSLLHSVQRSVFASRADNARNRTEAEITLASIMSKLERQLPRMPFPPRTKEALFDLNKVVERNRGLETEVTAGMHGAGLLREAVKREEEGLRRDREALRVLEENARTSEREYRKREKRVHPLLKDGGGHAAADDMPDDIDMVMEPTKTPEERAGIEMDEEDEDLAPLLDQLRNHLESMQTNTEQVEGVGEAMEGAFVALDGVLERYATREQYESLKGR